MHNTRVRSFNFILLVIFTIFLYQIYILQFNQKDYSNETIAEQSTKNFYFPSPRGDIYDRQGKLLARTITLPNLFFDKSSIFNDQDLKRYEEFIELYLPEDALQLFQKGFDSKNTIIDLGIINNELFNIISLTSVDYPAFLLIDFPLREYPYGSLASHVLGYTGIPNQDDVGLFPTSGLHQIVGKNGIERYYEEILSGSPTSLSLTKTNKLDYNLGSKGEDLFLTIDAEIQGFVEDSLSSGIELANKNIEPSFDRVEKGAVIILDIDTAEILAMASAPTFDPNQFISGISDAQFSQIQKNQAFNNFAIQGLYPPGSVFKVVPYWLSYNEEIYPEGIDNFDQKYFAEECLSFQFTDGSKQVYCDWKKDGHGYVDFHQAIQKSVNIYFWEIALKIWRLYENNENESLLQNYARDLGFGDFTGVDLPYERKGTVPDRELFEEWKITAPDRVREEGWLGGDLMNLIVGQGAITVTPIQVANAYANLIRGYTLSPRINTNYVSNNSDLRVLRIDSKFKQMFLSDLGLVTDPGGTAYKSFSIMGDSIYDTGGKTGTAQTTEGKNDTSWFVGLDSISNPTKIVVVVVEEGGSGSAVAAPIARRIIQYLNGIEVTPVEFGEVTE